LPRFETDPARLPASPGAYLILLELSSSAPLPPRFGDRMLRPGVFVYAGSARGPGGIRARAGRHFRAGGVRRWHIDWLTAAAVGCRALPLECLGECAAVAALSNSCFSMPI